MLAWTGVAAGGRRSACRWSWPVASSALPAATGPPWPPGRPALLARRGRAGPGAGRHAGLCAGAPRHAARAHPCRPPLPLLLLADLLAGAHRLQPDDAAGTVLPADAADDLPAAPAGTVRRGGRPGWQLMPNTNLVYGLADLRGYDAVDAADLPRSGRSRSIPTIPRAGWRLPAFQRGPVAAARPAQCPLYARAAGRATRTMPCSICARRAPATTSSAPSPAPSGRAKPSSPGATTSAKSQVFGATFGPAARGPPRLPSQIRPARRRRPGDRSVDAATLADDSWWTFRFPPIARVGRQAVLLQPRRARTCRSDQAVTVYYTRAATSTARARAWRRTGRSERRSRLPHRAALDPADPLFARALDGGAAGASVFENRRALAPRLAGPPGRSGARGTPRGWPAWLTRPSTRAAPPCSTRRLPTAEAACRRAPAGQRYGDITRYAPEPWRSRRPAAAPAAC